MAKFYIRFLLLVVLACVCLSQNKGVLAAPVETPTVAETVPITLLDVESTDQIQTDLSPESEGTRAARGLGLLSGKFGGLGFGHGGFGLKGFGGLGGLGFGGLHGLGGGFGGLGGFKPFFGKKFF